MFWTSGTQKQLFISSLPYKREWGKKAGAVSRQPQAKLVTQSRSFHSPSTGTEECSALKAELPWIIHWGLHRFILMALKKLPLAWACSWQGQPGLWEKEVQEQQLRYKLTVEARCRSRISTLAKANRSHPSEKTLSFAVRFPTNTSELGRRQMTQGA